jgi:TRAP-type C4-dicarboxylate transport system substrate-binding protein
MTTDRPAQHKGLNKAATRRDFLKYSALGAGTVASGMIAAPYVARAQDAQDYIVNIWGARGISHVEAVHEYVEILKQRTAGKLNVKLLPLYEDKDIADVVPAGRVDYTLATLGQLTGMAPALGLFGVPMFDDADHSERAIDGGVGELLNTQLAKYNTRVVAWFNIGSPLVTSKGKALTKPKDFEGSTFRVYSEDTAAWIKAVGGAPAFIPYAEQYLALQRGTVDGAVGGLNGLAAQNVWEVQDHVFYPEGLLGLVQLGFVINTERFAKHTPEVQAILEQWFKEHQAALRQGAKDEYWGTGAWQGKGAMEKLTTNGMTLTRPEDVNANWWPVLSPLRDKFIAAQGDAGAAISKVVADTRA